MLYLGFTDPFRFALNSFARRPRLLEWDARGRLRAESKEDMAKRGIHSPDRADALVMAWWCGRFMEYDDTPAPDPTPRRPSERLAVPILRKGVIL